MKYTKKCRMIESSGSLYHMIIDFSVPKML